jgi:hypothetical protein
LRRKLKCDSPTFNDLCNELVEQLAERSYQLELLSLQLRPIAQRCLDLADLPQNQKLLEQLTQEEKAEERRTRPSLGSQREVARVSVLQLGLPSLLFSCPAAVSFVAFP